MVPIVIKLCSCVYPSPMFEKPNVVERVFLAPPLIPSLLTRHIYLYAQITTTRRPVRAPGRSPANRSLSLNRSLCIRRQPPRPNPRKARPPGRRTSRRGGGPSRMTRVAPVCSAPFLFVLLFSCRVLCGFGYISFACWKMQRGLC